MATAKGRTTVNKKQKVTKNKTTRGSQWRLTRNKKQKINYPEDRNPDSSCQGHRVVGCNPLELSWSADWILATSKTPESLPELVGRLGLVQNDLVDGRQAGRPTNMDIRNPELDVPVGAGKDVPQAGLHSLGVATDLADILQNDAILLPKQKTRKNHKTSDYESPPILPTSFRLTQILLPKTNHKYYTTNENKQE